MLYILGFLFCAILGTAGHFLYNFTNNDKIIGFLFSKSESLYQHLKLGFTPILLWSFVLYFKVLYKDWIIPIVGISLLVFFICVAVPYIVTNKLFKINITFVNLFSFYFGLILAFLSTFLLFNSIYLSLYIKIIGVFSFISVIFSYLLQNLKIKKRVSIRHSRND